MNLKTLIVVSIIIIIVLFLIYWAGISAPRKEVILKTKIVESLYSHEVSTSYGVYYKWNGVEQQEPWWVIVKTKGEWMVVHLKDVADNNFEEIQRYTVKFDIKWINDYKFSPQPTRYQAILLLLGSQPLYSEEKKVFYNVLDQIKEFEKTK